MFELASERKLLSLDFLIYMEVELSLFRNMNVRTILEEQL